jgi:hypothetical protein
VSLKFDWLTMDCRNPMDVARFWEQALPAYELELGEVEGEDTKEVLLLPADKRGPKMLFLKVEDDEKVGKNRLRGERVLHPPRPDGRGEDEVG